MTVKRKKKYEKRGTALPPLPEEVTAEDIGRALVRPTKPVKPVTDESDKPPRKEDP